MMTNPLRCLYDRAMRIAAHKHAAWGLAGISFIESSVFPIPPDVVLMPMCLADRSKSFRYATICTVASVLGGILGYAIGYFLFESVGKTVLNFYGLMEQFASFQEKYNAWGGWIVFAGGLTPIPYKVITIASGVTHMNIAVFCMASVAGRAARFYLVAALLWKYGMPIQAFIEKYLGLLTILFFALLIGGFIGLKYLL
ncbi:MAG: YqaA family protein [Pseudomonadota bacterium]